VPSQVQKVSVISGVAKGATRILLRGGGEGRLKMEKNCDVILMTYLGDVI